ncbi:hypothetical protein EDB89DRAFT_2230573 [Lactarius sanguifluus]|nr:hypothetical protein EDB89DRAFT_2230573 [Lactarius sanguifluus]
MDANTREYQRQAIDAQIESLEESIRTLRTLRLRRNTLAPVSSLPTEVIATIFFFLRSRVTSESSASEPDERPDDLAWLRVTHVCHQWREIALNQPLFWDYVNFNTVSPAGAAEILARAKTVPLHLEARVPIGHWDDARFSAFQKELQARVPHIYRLDISAEFCRLHRIFEGLVSPAPTLKILSLSSEEYNDSVVLGRAVVPDILFNGSTPRLTCLELENCDISWNSPLLGSLKHLEISTPSERPSLSVWLDALDQIPQLETLALHWASPIAPFGASLLPDVDRTVTLPFLALFEISSFVRDCGLALAHLILPALTSLSIIARSCYMDWSDVRGILPYVSPHAHGSQDVQPLQRVAIDNDVADIHILAWTQPDIDVESPDDFDFFDSMHSARVEFSFTNEYRFPVTNTEVFDATHKPAGSGSATRRSGPGSGSVLLTPFAAHGFSEALLEDNGGRESPLLPSLTKLVLIDTALVDTTPRAHMTLCLCDALMKRVEQGIPLETLDLRTCLATIRAVELLSEIVVDVVSPEETVESEEQIISISGIFVGDEPDSDDD